MTRVHICDYGIGNIHNVARAIRHVGAETINCTSPDQLTNVERLVIPAGITERRLITQRLRITVV